MLKIKYFLLLFFAATFIYGQQKEITREEYNKKYESLKTQKENFLREKAALKSSIDSLTQVTAHLDSLLKDCMPAYLIHKYGKKIGTRIALGKIWKGMSEKMLRDSWGKPDKVRTRRWKWGVFRQYYYGNIIYFFRDGKLIDWKDGGKHK